MSGICPSWLCPDEQCPCTWHCADCMRFGAWGQCCSCCRSKGDDE